jgi:nucleotide-binding universal stress UspA family protein
VERKELEVKKIVVGVDGSPGSLDAMRWSVDEAALRGDEVVAVHAWSYPPVSTMHGALRVMEIDFAGAAAELLEAAVAEAVPGGSPVPIERVVVESPPAPALLDAAADAELLVVGSRGLGGFKGLLLGSVSQHCAHHAPCPVVVVRAAVRHPDDEAARRASTTGVPTGGRSR